jgi:ABC-2 type transport system ATP-binding protein
MRDAAVKVTAVTKRYKNGVLANDAIDLTIPRVKIFALVGPNGAGKTTLVRQITAQMMPTQGTISVLGVDVVRAPLAAKRLMGVVPQEVAPIDYISAWDHFLSFGMLRGLSRREAQQRAARIVGVLGLSEHARRMSSELSGGLKRKVMVGIAMIGEPPVLVLDEPTTGLDPRSRRDVWSLVRDLKSRGTTTLLTTHYMEEAEALADNVAVIDGGRIAAQGSVDELRAGLGANAKASFLDERGEERVLLGDTQEEVLLAIARLGIAEFSVGRPNLEDVFLKLTGARKFDRA